MTGGIQQFARVLEDRMKQHEFAELQRYWADPEYAAQIEAEVAATRATVQATMAAAVERHNPRKWA